MESYKNMDGGIVWALNGVQIKKNLKQWRECGGYQP